jgi:hypothetical protein
MPDWQSAANTIEEESAGTREVYWTRNTEATETQNQETEWEDKRQNEEMQEQWEDKRRRRE